jgi:PKD repeat protein
MLRRTNSGVILALTTVLALLIPAGCSTKDSATNPAGPTADFTASPVSGDRPLDVVFTNRSDSGSSPITSYLWTFGDGTSSGEANPGHLYASAGIYTVSLTVTTADGSNTSTKTDLITVSNGSGPTAGFTANPTAGASPLEVDFTDQSIPGGAAITSRAWTFGDGGTSTATNPTHTYNSNGTYTVSLTVTTSLGSDSETKTGYINVTPTPVGPTANFSGSPRTGNAPLAVDFTNLSTAGTQPITNYAWTFGDGGTSSSANPSHTYNAPGTYTVSLTVTTTVGSDTDTKTGYITVSPAPVAPKADFSGTPTSGAAPLTVSFTDLSTPGTSPILTRFWTFGDGSTSTETNPTHTYNAAGNYNVSLAVTTTDGTDSQTKNDYIKVCQIPSADFVGAPTTGVAPLNVLFTDLSTGNPSNRSWNFGDGGTSSSTNPSHQYSDPGTYTVSLTASNSCGSDTETKTAYITVGDPCPDPVYTIVSAGPWSNIDDNDNDGYRTRGRLTWNVNVSPTGCSKSVFARIYYRLVGDTDWLLGPQSPCYTVTGSRTMTPRNIFIDELPFGCYQFRIVLYECDGTVAEATLEPSQDPDLDNQCFELP